MDKPLFTGVCTALVTPFINDAVNYPLLDRLIKAQVDAGVHSIVLAGTTGEAPVLTDLEKIELFRRGKRFAGDDCLIIAGTGSNSTEHSVALSLAAEAAGADALLVVAPYYNKGNEESLYQHFLSITKAVNIPVIIYNVPSRTGVDIPVAVYSRLSKIPNIAGVKEASNDITKITKIRYSCPETFHIWSGNDDQVVPVIALGGQGVISVASNIYPAQMQAMAQAALTGDFKSAACMQCQIAPLIELLFSEVNPIPVKYAMRYTGFDCGGCRLPLGPPSPDLQIRIDRYFS